MAYSSPIRTRWSLPLISFQIHLLKPQQAFPVLGTCDLSLGCFSFGIVSQIFPLVGTLEISKESRGITHHLKVYFTQAWFGVKCVVSDNYIAKKGLSLLFQFNAA